MLHLGTFIPALTLAKHSSRNYLAQLAPANRILRVKSREQRQALWYGLVLACTSNCL